MLLPICFLFPSLYDNAPLVIREAAALGTPSVLIRDSTASEIISDSVNGFLSPNSTEAYSNRIREILCSTAIIKNRWERRHHELLPGHGKTWPVKCTIVITG